MTEEEFEICSKCKGKKLWWEMTKPNGNGIVKRKRMCQDCRNKADYAKQKKWEEAHPEEAKQRYREYDNRHNESRRNRWHNDINYREANKKAVAKYQAKNRKLLAQKIKDRNRKLRHDVIKKYGSECECCGEKHIEFLVIDHIEGGGNKERKLLNVYAIYKKLLDNITRLEGYRVLCHNCNAAYAFYGTCPHQRDALECINYESNVDI